LQTEKELQDKYFSASSRHFPLASMTSTQGALFYFIVLVFIKKRDHYLFYFNFKRLNYIMTSSKRTIFLSDLIYFIAELWIIKLSSLKN
jgi:hypothetical protein